VSSFGPLSIEWDGHQICRLGRGKLAALLCYLAVEPGQHRRETLAELLWPDLPAEAARLNLRQTAFQLRKLLMEATGQDFLYSDHEHLGIAAASLLRVRTADFCAPLPACINTSPKQCGACINHLTVQVDLYQGEFLADLSLPDCPGFSEWLQVKREAMRRHALDLVARLADCHEAQGRHRAALIFAQRYVALEPLSEAGHLRVIKLYALDGQSDGALAQYKSYRNLLERELSIAPNEEMRAVVNALKVGAGGTAPSLTVAELPTDDRRLITVLYCELQFAGVADPEDVIAPLRVLRTQCEEIGRRHFGHILNVYSGGLLVYFGYPQALESAALYAVRAARAMAAGAVPDIAVRVAVHSGLVVPAVMAQIPDPAGITSGIAIRLLGLAKAGEVIVSADTRQRVAGYFLFSVVSERRRNGLPEDIQAFRVVDATSATHRLSAAQRLTPFVGRKLELAYLMNTWERVRRGSFQALLISGEAGIGKSRLLRVLTDRLGNAARVVKLRCFPETMHSPLHPVTRLYEKLCGFNPTDNGEVRIGKLLEMLQSNVPHLADRAVPLLAHMLRLMMETLSPLPIPTPERMQAATAELLIDLLPALATTNPVLFIVEDLHWADASTLDVLARLMTRRVAAPILVLLTARAEWHLGWPDVDLITLKPLTKTDVTAIAGAVQPDITPMQTSRIVSLADGIPLFAEELAAVLHEHPQLDTLPINLHDLLMAQLDQLGPTRALAKTAATIGREFDIEVLSRVSGLWSEALQRGISELVDSGLVLVATKQRLLFKHALVQSAAYQSQTRAARRAVHRRLAEVLGTLDERVSGGPIGAIEPVSDSLHT
jgi:DNA-binding SARP family transcriptional activator